MLVRLQGCWQLSRTAAHYKAGVRVTIATQGTLLSHGKRWSRILIAAICSFCVLGIASRSSAYCLAHARGPSQVCAFLLQVTRRKARVENGEESEDDTESTPPSYKHGNGAAAEASTSHEAAAAPAAPVPLPPSQDEQEPAHEWPPHQPLAGYESTKNTDQNVPLAAAGPVQAEMPAVYMPAAYSEQPPLLLNGTQILRSPRLGMAPDGSEYASAMSQAEVENQQPLPPSQRHSTQLAYYLEMGLTSSGNSDGPHLRPSTAGHFRQDAIDDPAYMSPSGQPSPAASVAGLTLAAQHHHHPHQSMSLSGGGGVGFGRRATSGVDKAS